MGISSAGAPRLAFYPPILSLNFHIESLASRFMFNSVVRCNTVLQDGNRRVVYFRPIFFRNRKIHINRAEFLWFGPNDEICPFKEFFKYIEKIILGTCRLSPSGILPYSSFS